LISFSIISTDPDMELEYEFPGVLCYYKSGHIERFDGTTVAPATIDPITGVKSKDVVIDESTGLSVRLYLPNLKYFNNKLPILFFIHGGAFMIHTAGSPVYHNLVNCLVSNAKAIAVSVTYRLAPEYPVPVPYEDALDALKWVVSICRSGTEPWLSKHGNPDHIILAGDSAGANIAHNLAVWSDRELLKDFPKIKGLLLMNPYFWGKDPIETEALEPDFRYWLDQTWNFICAGKFDLDHPFLNPILATREEWMMPRCDRVMVTVAENDMFRERGRAYVETLQSNGWKGEVEMYETYGERHVYFLAKPKCEKAVKEIKAMAAFINKK
jgi:acetyl esterase/lipase